MYGLSVSCIKLGNQEIDVQGFLEISIAISNTLFYESGVGYMNINSVLTHSTTVQQ